MKRDIRLDVAYAHPPERVWAALTSSEAIAAWLMPNDFKAELGHRFTLRTDPAPGFDGVVRCEVLELDPPRAMSWSWVGGPIDTVVRFRLAPEGPGTRLFFEQTGFEGLPAILTSFILGSGSKRIYRQRLPQVLERLARGERLVQEGDTLGCKDAPLERAAGEAVGLLSE